MTIITNNNDYYIDKYVISHFKDDTLQDIRVLSGPNAEDNEYQVHYWSLNSTFILDDDSEVIVSTPLVVFNYPMKVSLASIDFELTDVENMSEKLKPLAVKLANSWIPLLDDRLKLTTLGRKSKEIKHSVVSLNTLHRHP